MTVRGDASDALIISGNLRRPCVAAGTHTVDGITHDLYTLDTGANRRTVAVQQGGPLSMGAPVPDLTTLTPAQGFIVQGDGGGSNAGEAYAICGRSMATNAAPSGAVTLSGTVERGQTLSASNTLADGDGLGAVSYQWQSSADGSTWANIAGANGASYTLAYSDMTQQVRGLGPSPRYGSRAAGFCRLPCDRVATLAVGAAAA